MTIQDAIKSAAELLELAAKAAKDKGAVEYSAQSHKNAVGIAMWKCFAKQGLEATPANYADLFGALYNHSAWRQKFEKMNIFTKASERTAKQGVDDLLAELGEE